MKKYISSIFLLSILVGCSSGSSGSSVSLDNLLENPLFAERYADTLVDSVVEFKIQKDPMLEDASKADIIEDTRTKWLKEAQKATVLQREGVRLERHPTGQPQPAALQDPGRRRFEDRTHQRGGLWVDRLGDPQRPPSDPGRQRPGIRARPQRGIRTLDPVGLPGVQQLCPVRRRRNRRRGLASALVGAKRMS